jgi:hypothetical protein
VTIGFFAFNGLSLLTKSRLSFCLLAVFAFLPLLGSLAGAVHLLALIVNGQMATSPADTIVSLIGTVQALVIVALYLALASRATRAYVWTQSPPLVADH